MGGSGETGLVGGSGEAGKRAFWLVLAFFLLTGILLAGCGEVVLEELPPDTPAPLCEDGLVPDPELGICVEPFCRSNDDCEPEERCDLIRGRCVPVCEGAGGCEAPGS